MLVKLTVIPKLFAQLLNAYNLGFLIFWRKDFGAKVAHKMLVKLTLGVNFTNTLWAAFAPKSFPQKITNPNCEHIKAAQKTFALKKLLVKYW